MNFISKALKRGAVALAFGAVMVAGAGVTANAQGHGRGHERRDLQRHQRQERSYYGNSHATRDHQSAERYGNAAGHGRNGGYYNGGSYGGSVPYNNGHANGGYYGNGRSYGNNGYSRPHRDSRNPVRRAIHHARGGH